MNEGKVLKLLQALTDNIEYVDKQILLVPDLHTDFEIVNTKSKDKLQGAKNAYMHCILLIIKATKE